LLLKLADKEWHGVILWGYYSGQRLQDIVTATWRSVDQKTKSWTFVTKKTHRKMTLPLAAPLLKYLNSLKRKPGQIWIFPKLASSVQRTGGQSCSRLGLSRAPARGEVPNDNKTNSRSTVFGTPPIRS
jgi:integrase